MWFLCGESINPLKIKNRNSYRIEFHEWKNTVRYGGAFARYSLFDALDTSSCGEDVNFFDSHLYVDACGVCFLCDAEHRRPSFDSPCLCTTSEIIRETLFAIIQRVLIMHWTEHNFHLHIYAFRTSYRQSEETLFPTGNRKLFFSIFIWGAPVTFNKERS